MVSKTLILILNTNFNSILRKSNVITKMTDNTDKQKERSMNISNLFRQQIIKINNFSKTSDLSDHIIYGE